MTMTEKGTESMGRAADRSSRRAWWYTAGAIVTVLVAGALAFAILEPIQVLPRVRLAPGFSMTDQHGETVTSEDLRGSIVLYTFTYAGCNDPCPSAEGTLAAIRDRLGEVDLGGTPIELVTVSFDPQRDTSQRLAERAARFGADGDQWWYATPAVDRARTVVSTGFRTFFEDRGDGTFAFDPNMVLVDGWGVVRGEYRYQTLTPDVDKVIRHLIILGDEIRNSHGTAGLAYEAAHFFLCYP